MGMHSYEIPSTFVRRTVIFHYSAEQKTNRAVFILKGLYGEHVPPNIGAKQSWDNELIDLLKAQYEVFIFNTGRHNTHDKKEAFVGKTYQNECDDMKRAFAFCREKILKRDFLQEIITMSFGGTVLMGCPEILETAQSVVMIGSGCGKSPTTTKPLVSTLPDAPDLLKAISKFTGSLYFLHGGKDTIVSLESQKKIYESAAYCFSRGWIEFPELDHELNNPKTGESHTAILVAKFLNASFSR